VVDHIKADLRDIGCRNIGVIELAQDRGPKFGL
jgi:hypothetical protein